MLLKNQNQSSLLLQQMLNLIKHQSTSIITNITFKTNIFFVPLPKSLTTSRFHISTQTLTKNLSNNKLIFSNLSKFSTIQQLKMQPQIKQTKPQSKNQIEEQINETVAQIPQQQFQQGLFEETNLTQKLSKDPQQQKSKGLKRKEKLQQIRTNLKDVQVRRQRNRQRHRKQKEKLQKNLEGKSEEQIKQYLTIRKDAKRLTKQKVKQEVEQQLGRAFLIDNAFEHRMNEKENKSLAMQVQLIMKTLKSIHPAPNVHLCGLKQNGIVKEQLIKAKYQYWPIKSYDLPLEECLKMQKFKNKNVYYLSPDAKKTIDMIEENDIFIIGGLVDRSVIKYASLNRAEELKIQARSLPIRPFMKQRTCLNLDHVVAIVCKFVEVKDWKVAFEHGAPKRWVKGEGEVGLKELKDDSDSDSVYDEEEDVQKTEGKSQGENVDEKKISNE